MIKPIDENSKKGMQEVAGFPAITKPTSSKFFERTTIHGLLHIYEAQNSLTRLAWMCLFGSVFTFFIWQVSELLKRLTAKEIITVTTSSLQKKMEFPRVILCNVSPFRQSQLHRFNITKPKISEISNFTEKQRRIIESMLYSKVLGRIPLRHLQKLGHQEDFFLLEKLNYCKFAGSKCRFVKITDPFLGNCFILFPYQNILKRAGRHVGLSVVMNIDQQDYTYVEKFGYNGAGVLVRVQNALEPIEYYSMMSNAILASPGTLTQIKLEKHEMKRLEDPYPDKCHKSDRVTEYNGLALNNPLPYSPALCQLACFIKLQLLTCGFVSSRFEALYREYVNLEKTKAYFSNATDPSVILNESMCLEKAEAQFLNENCDCRPLCREEYFRMTVSTVTWPADVETYELSKELDSLYGFQNWTRARISKNLLKLEVFFKDFRVEKIEQKPAYSWTDFLSGFGGQAGLWVGASVFSVIELVTFIVSFTINKYRLRKHHP